MRALALAVLVVFGISEYAFGQTPQVEREISTVMALAIVSGAVEHCAKESYRVSAVVVDKAGQMAASLRADGAAPFTMELARIKAYMAHTRKKTSQEFATETIARDLTLLRQNSGVIAASGGLPVKAGSDTIGAVGVSGAPGGDKDEVCAKAGIARSMGLASSPCPQSYELIQSVCVHAVTGDIELPLR